MCDEAFETITWIPVAQELPDHAMTCLVAVNGEAEPTWLGFLNDENAWCDVSTGAPFASPVTHWADLPAGPNH